MGKPSNIFRNFHETDNNVIEYRRNKDDKLDTGNSRIKNICKLFELLIGIAPRDKRRGGTHKHYNGGFNQHGKRSCYPKGGKVEFCIFKTGDKSNEEWLLNSHHQPGKSQGHPEKKNPAICQTSGSIHDF